GLVRRRPDARLRPWPAELLPLSAASRPARRPRRHDLAAQPGRLARRSLTAPAGTPPALSAATVGIEHARGWLRHHPPGAEGPARGRGAAGAGLRGAALAAPFSGAGQIGR